MWNKKYYMIYFLMSILKAPAFVMPTSCKHLPFGTESTVSTAAKLGEHFTISATGVVHAWNPSGDQM